MTTFTRTALTASILLASTPALAEGGAPDRAAPATCSGAAHVVHSITVNKKATCVVSKLYEPQAFCLESAAGADVANVPFEVVPGTPASFGMLFNDSADFNMEYAITCTLEDGAGAQSPKEIFMIGANGPGDPHVLSVELYGAQGAYVGVGDQLNFTVTF
jgi:hypothetical protein